jgi:hypothetical protein
VQPAISRTRSARELAALTLSASLVAVGCTAVGCTKDAVVLAGDDGDSGVSAFADAGDSGTFPTSTTKDCPASSPDPDGVCTGDLQCDYGTECCNGGCFTSETCTCMAGTWSCADSDACLGAVDPCGNGAISCTKPRPADAGSDGAVDAAATDAGLE